MNRFEAMGIGRSLEPVNSILQPAWKIDNDMRLRPGELLIDVKIININLTSFNEIGEETEFDEVLFRRRILEIIDQRGKLHNPITGHRRNAVRPRFKNGSAIRKPLRPAGRR